MKNGARLEYLGSLWRESWNVLERVYVEPCNKAIRYQKGFQVEPV